MPRMLFVCTGNICRSPFAERYAAKLAGNRGSTWEFASAGTGALVGSGMESLMSAQLRSRGGSDEGFVAQQLNGSLINSGDLIVAMEVYHRSFVLDDFPGLVRKTYTLGQLRRLVADRPATERGSALIDSIGQFRHRARDEDDIADPYRRGAQSAAAAATQIAGHLDEIIERLTC